MSIQRGPLFVLVASFFIDVSFGGYLLPGWQSPPIEPPTKPQVYGEDELYHPDPSYYQPLYPGGLWAKKYYPRAIGSFYSGNVLKDKNGFNIHSDVEILELEKKEQALENAKEEIEREKEEIEDEENEVERKKAIAKQAMVQESRPGDILSVSPDKNTIDYLTEQELRSRAQEKRWAEMYNQFLHPSTWEQSKYNSDSTFEDWKNSRKSRYRWRPSRPWSRYPAISRGYGSWGTQSEANLEAARRLALARKYGTAYYGPYQWNNNPSPHWSSHYESNAESESHKDQYQKETFENHSEVGPNRSLKLDTDNDEVKAPTSVAPLAPQDLPPADWRRRFLTWPARPIAQGWEWHKPTPEASPIHIKIVVETKCLNASAHANEENPKPKLPIFIDPLLNFPREDYHATLEEEQQEQRGTQEQYSIDHVGDLPRPILPPSPSRNWNRPGFSQWRQDELEALWKSTHSKRNSKWGWNSWNQGLPKAQEEPFRWQPSVPKWDGGGFEADVVDLGYPDLLGQQEQDPAWNSRQNQPFTRPLIQQEEEFSHNQEQNNDARQAHQISHWGEGPNQQLGSSAAWAAQQQSHNQQSQKWKSAQAGSWEPTWKK